MIALTISEIAKIVHGQIHQLADELIIDQYPVIDSRLVSNKTFFAAYKGESVDGHDYVSAAISAGAPFALVSQAVEAPSIIVGDVTKALSLLAHELRKRLSNLKVIGITGSQGKTTTKDLLRHILEIDGQTVAPEGSLNNEIGVPLTLLRCTPSTRYCILEMGARHVGDIAHLVEIAEPNVGMVLVVGSAHVGEFGSRENIAEAKAEMISSLPDGATAILGTYDPYTPRMADGLAFPVITFGESHDCNVRAADLEYREGRAHFDLVTSHGRTAVSLQIVGAHQLPNALGAAAVATALDIPIDTIAAALSTAEAASKWRMEMHDVNGLLLINDSYNANPESTAAALRTLALLAQERGGVTWAFLGKMHELGESTAEDHAEIGKLAREIGIDNLVSVGTDLYLESSDVGDLENGDLENGDETVMHSFATRDDALSLVRHFSPGDVVLVKASRAENFELLAEGILSTWRVGQAE